MNLIMDAYTDQILAIDVYSYDYTKDWKDIADHLEDIPAGFLTFEILDTEPSSIISSFFLI